MIAATLLRDDYLWALDHSRRRFRVRATRVEERPSQLSLRGLITVVPLDGSRPVVMTERCIQFPDEAIDSDGYAEARLRAIRANHVRRWGAVR